MFVKLLKTGVTVRVSPKREGGRTKIGPLSLNPSINASSLSMAPHPLCQCMDACEKIALAPHQFDGNRLHPDPRLGQGEGIRTRTGDQRGKRWISIIVKRP